MDLPGSFLTCQVQVTTGGCGGASERPCGWRRPYLNRYNRAVVYTVLLTVEAGQWLDTCHSVAAERVKIIARFRFAFGVLREFGPQVGRPHVDRIGGYDNLWDLRVGHRTGAYRAFFGLAPSGAVILVAYGDVKKRARFPPEVYRLAEQKVRQAVQEYEQERRTPHERSRFVSPP